MTQHRPNPEFEYFLHSNPELYAYLQENLDKERRESRLMIMLLSGVLAPAAWGHRGPLAPIIAGGLGLLFFGPGSVLLIIRQFRRRMRTNTSRQPGSYQYG